LATTVFSYHLSARFSPRNTLLLLMESNQTVERNIPWLFQLGQEDSNWVMTSSFIILTMQTGDKTTKT